MPWPPLTNSSGASLGKPSCIEISYRGGKRRDEKFNFRFYKLAMKFYPLLENGNADLEVGDGLVVWLVDGHWIVWLLLLRGRRPGVKVAQSRGFAVRDGRRGRVDGTRRHLRWSKLDVHQRRLVDGQRCQQSRRTEISQSAQAVRIVGRSAATVRLGNVGIAARRRRVNSRRRVLLVLLLLLMVVQSILLLLLLLRCQVMFGQNVNALLDRKIQLQSGYLVDVRAERVLVIGAHVGIVGQFK